LHEFLWMHYFVVSSFSPKKLLYICLQIPCVAHWWTEETIEHPRNKSHKSRQKKRSGGEKGVPIKNGWSELDSCNQSKSHWPPFNFRVNYIAMYSWQRCQSHHSTQLPNQQATEADEPACVVRACAPAQFGGQATSQFAVLCAPVCCAGLQWLKRNWDLSIRSRRQLSPVRVVWSDDIVHAPELMPGLPCTHQRSVPKH
jgi:hypothetical protein